MKRLTRYLLFGFLILTLLLAVGYLVIRQQVNIAPTIGPGAEVDPELPPGFTATIFARGMDGPRFIEFGPDGRLYVADRRNGRIVSFADADGDGVAEDMQIFAAGLDAPHDIVHHQGEWYAGVPGGVVRLDDTNGDGVANAQTVLNDTYTPTGNHSTRTLLFLPDGRLLLSAGSTCNVCEEEDPRRAAITIYDSPVGQDTLTGERIFAAGLRNAVGLDLHPETGAIFATNNGRDLIGDDFPPETINLVRDGEDFGWPHCINGHTEDPDLGFAGACDGITPPAFEFQAHSAPLGLDFYTGTAFPAEYRGDLFVAYHGSWNRSEPTGYKVARMIIEGEQIIGVEDFATGWLLPNGGSAGRPVDVETGPDGALYISDDRGGFVYRIAYTGTP